MSSPKKPTKNVISNHRNAEKKDDQLVRWEEELVWATVGNFVVEL